MTASVYTFVLQIWHNFLCYVIQLNLLTGCESGVAEDEGKQKKEKSGQSMLGCVPDILSCKISRRGWDMLQTDFSLFQFVIMGIEKSVAVWGG